MKWTKETIALEAKKYLTRTDFSKGSNVAYKKALELDILDNVCRHIRLGSHQEWTKESILLYASHYEYLSDFRRDYPTALAKSVQLGIRDQIKLKQAGKGAVLDTIYIFKQLDSKPYKGCELFKIGVSSSKRRVEGRKEELEKKNKIKLEIITSCIVGKNAPKLEVILLQLGVKGKEYNIYGGSEFRYLSLNELDKALEIITLFKKIGDILSK